MMPDLVPVDLAVDPAPTVDAAPPSVRDLLKLSQAAHLRYQAAVPRMAAAGALVQANPGDAEESQTQLKAAANARAQAELQDPTHSDPSWAAEAATYPHQELLVFYLLQLSK